nr:hypothetical protein Q903MT_gene5137 [Picea sitchensis]
MKCLSRGILMPLLSNSSGKMAPLIRLGSSRRVKALIFSNGPFSMEYERAPYLI